MPDAILARDKFKGLGFIDYKNGVVKVNNSLLTVVLSDEQAPSDARITQTPAVLKHTAGSKKTARMRSLT